MELHNETARPPLGEHAREVGSFTFYEAERLLGEVYNLLGIHVSDDDRTPWRVAKWLQTFAGKPDHSTDLPEDITRAIQNDAHDELVVVKDIEFVALCEHHFLPFKGKAMVGYIPQGKMIGLSKLARIVHHYTRFPTLQEHITTHVADALQVNLDALGTMVVLYDVMHSCMSMRGIKEHEATTTTSAVRGVFRTEPAARAEFLSLR